MSEAGNSNRICRDYMDSLLIETRYMNAVTPDTSFELYGEKFSSPIMTAALSHLDHFVEKGMAKAYAEGARDAGCVCWYGMAEEDEIEMMADTGVKLIEIIKPYADREKIYRKIEHAGKLGLLAVGIDIDHAFGDTGLPDICFNEEMRAMTTKELTDICEASPLPVIVKGVLSCYDAKEALKAGVSGMVISHHNNRIEYAIPPLKILPEIAALTGGRVPLFVDCMIQSGMDTFKALALGASAVSIGRPLMTAYKDNHESGIRDYLEKTREELAKAMGYTGTGNLKMMDPSVIRR